MNTENKLPPDFKQKWIAALRSGEYKQAKGQLYNGEGYCCLGVACKVAGYNNDDIMGECLIYNPKFPKVPDILINDDIGDELIDYLTNMNDGGKSFSEIADYIEENL